MHTVTLLQWVLYRPVCILLYEIYIIFVRTAEHNLFVEKEEERVRVKELLNLSPKSFSSPYPAD